MDKKYSFEELVEIVRTLRSPEGCPWDRKQTHDSLRPCMTEETAELLAAIRIYDQTGNPENMREELGDIILQSVMHSVIAEEEGLFAMEDVVSEVAEKMVRRHPHVFGDPSGRKTKVSWEEIKKEEKAGKSWVKSPLAEIPRELPALARATKVIRKAGKVYHTEFPEETAVLQELASDLKQLETQQDESRYEKTLVQMIWRLCEIAQKRQISLEQGLSDFIENRIEKYESNPPKTL